MRVPNWLKITAALWAAVFLLIAFTLPPATRQAESFIGGHVRRGAFHVHTVDSDGGGTREDVARAAAAAGLGFVIVTDHGDGTAPPAPPEYIHSVLVMDGVEVTTSAGHYATFGAAQSPYPLGGPPYAVIEDIARLGGFGVAAHPDSTKADLRWRDWNAHVDGIEWINGDSAWRDEGPMALARGIVDYLFRPTAALAALVERPARLLQRIDDISRARRIVALAAADAHARLPLTDDAEPYESAWTVPAPSYKQSFRAFANLVETGQPISGNAATDAAALAAAIRAGRVTFAMTSLAEPAQLHFIARSSDDVARPIGSRIPEGEAITFEARTSEVLKSGRSLVRLALTRDGRVVTAVEGSHLSHRMEDARGVWRVEASLAHKPDVPWLLSNPIVVTEAPASTEPPAFPAGAAEAALDLTRGQWTIEHHPACTGSVSATTGAQSFSYRLSGGMRSGQFVAAVRETDSTDSWEDVVLTMRASGPARVWVQLRLSDSGTGQRWGRSVYLDTQSRTLRLPIRDFAALEPQASVSRPNVVQVRAVMLVVDTVNTAPGSTGEILLERVALERRRLPSS